jgi:hypothetical protein
MAHMTPVSRQTRGSIRKEKGDRGYSCGPSPARNAHIAPTIAMHEVATMTYCGRGSAFCHVLATDFMLKHAAAG